MEDHEPDFMEKSLLDYKDEASTDIKIRPTYYIHDALYMAPRELVLVGRTNIQQGILGYRILIEHIEILCKAAGYLQDDYYKKIVEFQGSEEVQAIEEQDSRSLKIAQKKMELLLTEVFGRSPLTEPMRI